MRWLVDLRPGEARSTYASFFCLFGMLASHMLLETARDALFLAKLPATQLPWVYLAIAVLGLPMAKLGRGGGSKRLTLPLTLLAAGAVTTAFWLLTARPNTALLYALYVWSGVFASIVVVQFWLLVSGLFTVTQAKRLFAFIGGGSVLGAVVGAAFASALSQIAPARHLLLGSAAVLAITALGPAAVLRPATKDDVKPTSKEKVESLGASELLRQPYLRRILIVALASTLTVTVVDYVFKAAVAERVPAAELGTVFANVYVVLNSIALVVQFAAVSFTFRVLGVHRAILIMPVLILAGSGALMLGGGLVAALALKGVDGSLRHSLHRTGTELLFVPLGDRTRGRVKPLVDLIGQRGGQAIASLAILGLVQLGLGEQGLALFVGALALCWVAGVVGIQGPYLDLFRARLREGKVDYDERLPLLDLGALEALFAGLNSPKDAEVLASVELLAAQRRERLIPALLLYHPSRRVVLKALDVFTRQQRKDFLPVTERLLKHDDPEIRVAALRARAAVAPDEAFLREGLKDERADMRATALVSLVSQGWLSGDEAQQQLEKLIDDPDPVVRIALSRAIAAQPSPAFEETLLAVVQGGEAEVQVEAAWAMASVGSPRFIPPLVELLDQRLPGSAAQDALVAIGEPALAALQQLLGDSGARPELRISAPRAIALFPPEHAAPILQKHLAEGEEGVVRYRVLRALGRLQAREPEVELDEKTLRTATERAVRSAVRSLAWRVTLSESCVKHPERKTDARRLLQEVLKDKESHALSRVFRLLRLLHPGESFERIRRGLRKPDPRTRAASRELIENVVALPLREAILALIDDLPDAERVARVPASYRPDATTDLNLLEVLVERGRELGQIASFHAQEIGVGAAAELALDASTLRAAFSTSELD